MPFIHVSLSVQISQEKKQILAEQIGHLIAQIPGKTYEKTMIRIDDGCDIYRAGQKADLVFLETRLYQVSEMEDKKQYIKQLFDLVQKELGISKTDAYFNIIELDHWGSRGDFR